VAGLSLALLGGLGGIALGIGLSARAPSQPQAAALTGPECSVNYQLMSDDGRQFVADIMATNTGQALPTGWHLTMQLPDQPAGLRPSGDWSLNGTTLTSPAQNPLPAGGSVRLTLTARHSNDTVLPATFDLSGHTCEASLSGPDGAPLAPGATFVSSQPDQRDNGHGHDGGKDGGGSGPH
jgi:eukaryotic-like serine/threonine-protein kinase